MHYFIDGYNFLFHFYEDVDPLERTRKDLLEYLQEHLFASNLNLTIVFDSHHVKHKDIPTRFDVEKLEVIYTPSHQTADNYILEALASNRHNSKETVITSDKGLMLHAKNLGAKVLSVEVFLDKLLSHKLKKHYRESKQQEESYEDFHRLLKIFEQRLLEDD